MINTITIKEDFSFYKLKDRVWSGAVDTMQRIADEHKEEELISLLNEVFCEQQPDITEINDYLWFESDDIYEYLGISSDEDE